MSQVISSGDAGVADAADERESADEGGTSDQVMHAQDESKAEGDRDESDD
jgi:hypothetical protein